MKNDATRRRWILVWTDRSGDADREVYASADSVEETREAI